MTARQTPIPENTSFDAIVVGAGVIGLATAFELSRTGAEVIVLDAAASPGTGATRVAAGMLAPVGELDFGEPALLEINLRSAELYPEFVAAVEGAGGLETDYRRCGGLHVALDRDEAAELKRVLDLQLSLGLDSRWLGPMASRELEPGLHPGLNGSVLAEGDGIIDPRALTAALLAALAERGVPVVTAAQVAALETGTSGSGAHDETGRAARAENAGRVGMTGRAGSTARVTGVRLADGRIVRAATVVAAGGAESGRSNWLPEADRPPARPVKGQVVELRGDPAEPVCERILASERVYLVPRSDGRLIVGATVEELGFDTAVTAGGIHELLREAYRLLPDVAELEFVEATAGLRPGTPDNVPVVGPASTPGLILATGHYRNGILLAPVTAEAVAGLVGSEAGPGDVAEGLMAAASPLRFDQSGRDQERVASDLPAPDDGSTGRVAAR
jgi:glycine oxidase